MRTLELLQLEFRICSYRLGVTIFETAGNNPGPIVKYLKSQGAIVLHKCTTVRHAKSAQKMGVDFLSIDGFECTYFARLSCREIGRGLN